MLFSDGQTTWGCIIKTREGNTLIQATKKQHIYVSPCLAEAFEVRWCLEMTKTLKWRNISIMTDALAMVDCIQDHLTIKEI